MVVVPLFGVKVDVFGEGVGWFICGLVVGWIGLSC